MRIAFAVSLICLVGVANARTTKFWGSQDNDFGGAVGLGTITAAELPNFSPRNGYSIYCKDCDASCSSLGMGAEAFRMHGAWNCNFGASGGTTLTSCGGEQANTVAFWTSPGNLCFDGLFKWNPGTGSLIAGKMLDLGGAVYNVKAFGAVGDGSTDDTTAISNAITTAGGAGTVFFPCGTYKLTSALSIPADNTHWLGSGLCTVLKQFTATTDAIQNNSGGRRQNITIEGFEITCNTLTTCATGLHLNQVTNSVFRDIEVNSTSAEGYTTGVWLDTTVTPGSYRNVLYNVKGHAITGAGSVGIKMSGPNIGTPWDGSNSTRIFGGYAQADTGIGMLIMDGNQYLVDGVVFEGGSSVGLKVATNNPSGGQRAVITGCRFENTSGGPNTALLYDTNATGNVDIGNVFTPPNSVFADNSSGTNQGRNTSIEPLLTPNTGFGGIFLGRGDIKTNLGAVVGTQATTDVTSTEVLQARSTASDGNGRWFARADGRWGMGSGNATQATNEEIIFERSATNVMRLQTGATAMSASTASTLPVASGFFMGSTTGSGKLVSDSGTPLSNVVAPQGSLYGRTDGGESTSCYSKEGGGSANTGWRPVVTWDDTNAIIRAYGTETASQFLADVASNTASISPLYRSKRSDGTLTSRTAVSNNDVLADFGGVGFNGSSFPIENGGIHIVASQAYSVGAEGATMDFFTTPNSTASPALGMRLADDGSLLINTTSKISSAKLVVRDGDIALANTGTAAKLKLLEPSGSGANFTAFVAQAQGVDITYTMPAAQGAANSVWLNDGTGTLTSAVILPTIYFGSAATTLAAGSSTFFAGLSGSITTAGGAENLVQSPSPAATYKNLRCTPSATTGGTGIVVTARVGACGSQSTGTLTVTVTTANTTVSDTTNSAAPTAGQCIDFQMVEGATTTPAAVNCVVERLG